MVSPWWLLALAQGAVPPPPTVGDTVWAARTIGVPPGTMVRARPIPASALLDPLAPPAVILRAGTALLRYPLVVWRPGRHAVELPGPILVRADGWSDTLPALEVTLEVASVLPPARRDTLAPKPPAAALAGAERSLAPAALFGLAALILLVPLHWWRRRGPRRPAAEAPAPAPGPDPATLVRWLEQGETRAALDGWSSVLEHGPSDHLPPPTAAGVITRLEAARYAPLGSAGVTETVAQLRREGKTR